MKWLRGFHLRLVRFLFVSLVIAMLQLAFFGNAGEVIAFKDGILKISDFSYYLVMVRAFWFQGANGFHRGFYNLQDNLATLSEFAGSPIGGIMPLAVTPSALLLFWPFACLSFSGFHLAKAAWCGVSIAAVLCALREYPRWSGFPRAVRLRLGTAGLIFLGSHAFFTTLWLGQTSLLFLASMMVIFRALRAAKREYPLAALFFVGLKPTYFGLAALLLLTFRAWRLLAIALGFLVLSCALMTAMTGTAWFGEYRQMFSVFSRAELEPYFQAPFVFDRMNIFRSAWAGFASQETLLLASKLVLLLAIAVTAMSLAAEFLKRRPAAREAGLARFILLAGAYLLFSPYLSTYEDIFLFFPVLLLAAVQPPALESKGFLAVLLLLFCSLNFLTLLEVIPREVLWMLKAGLIIVVAFPLRSSALLIAKLSKDR